MILKYFSLAKGFINSKTLFTLLFIIVDLCVAVVFGLSQSIDIPTFHLDGAYQTASGLYRLADGQWPGKDFYPYLGIGLTYLHYPFFRLAGNDLAASVFASHFLVACSYAFVIGTISSFLARSNQFITGVYFSSVMLVITLRYYPHLPDSLIERLLPGNSLRPLRSLLPYIATVIIYFILRARLKLSSTYGLIGIVAGLCFLWSNDYGIPTSVCIIGFAIYWAYQTKTLTPRLAALIVISALLAATAGLCVATKGHGLNLLKYNFFDVGGDQFWYFAPWSAETRILTLGDLWNKLAQDFGSWSLVLLLLTTTIFFRPKLEYVLLLVIGLALVGGGALASIGGHRDFGYLLAFFFWCKATALFGMIFFLSTVALYAAPIKCSLRHINVWHYAAISILVGTVIFSVPIIRHYERAMKSAQSDPGRFYVYELGGYLPVEWREYVTQARESKELSVLEEYWGLWSAIARKHGVPPVDSVIHALGNTRTVFYNAINSLPDIVITTRYAMGTDWQQWSLSTNYWFYKPLMENYAPFITSPSTIVWQRAKSKDKPPVSCIVNEHGGVTMSALPGYYEMSLQLKYLGERRSLLMVRNNINFAVDANGYLSLNPRSNMAEFPVIATRAGENEYDIKVIGSDTNKKNSYSVLGCTARKIVVEDPEILPLSTYRADNMAYNLSDAGWLNGVARNFPGFFVLYSRLNKDEFAQGKAIRFANGEIRHIIRQEIAGRFINIYLDGMPLDGELVGYPNKFEVII